MTRLTQRLTVSFLAGGLLLVTPIAAKFATAQVPIASFPGLELPAAKRAALEQKRMQIRSQLERIVTPDQRNQFKASLEAGQSVQAAIAVMNLTPDQQSQIRQVMQATRGELQATFTPEQRQQLRQTLRDWMQQR